MAALFFCFVGKFEAFRLTCFALEARRLRCVSEQVFDN